MITVHHLNNSRSQRILWLLEEIGVDYDIVRYQRDSNTMRAPVELRQVHPLGKSPLISDKGQTYAESAAIIEYLVDTYGGHLKPATDSALYRDYVYWLHFSEGSLMPPLLVKLIGDRLTEAKVPFFVKPIVKSISKQMEQNFYGPEISSLLEFINDHLGKNQWFCGEAFSAADIQMSFPLEASAARAPGFARYANIVSFVDRIHTRPAYQAALERGGEYDYA